MDLARGHWMEPLVAWYLNIDCAGMFATDFDDGLRTTLHRSTTNLMLLSANLIKILRILKAHTIPVVPFKGPVLATMLCDEFLGARAATSTCWCAAPTSHGPKTR
jgi:hypothetical protein